MIENRNELTVSDFGKNFQKGEKITALKFEIKGLQRLNAEIGVNSTSKILGTIYNDLVDIVSEYGEIYRNTSRRNMYYVQLINDKSKECVKEVHGIISEYFKKSFIEKYLLSFEIACGAIVDYDYDETYIFKRVLDLALQFSNDNTLYPLTFINLKEYKEYRRQRKLIEKIKKSILKNCEGFILEYQPLVSGINSKIIGAEALIRWKQNKNIIIPPGMFIKSIENVSCYYDLGMWIIRKSIEDFKEIIKSKPEFFININLSYSQLENENFKYELISILNELEFPCKNLQLELTERCKELDIEYLKEQLLYFRNKGIKIALDDFGTGTSTLELIAKLPIDCLKIDQTFIKNILDNPANVVIVETALDCAKKLGISVCLEGVETEDIKDFVAKYYANYHQGYFYSKPISIERFNEIIDKTWKTPGIRLIKANDKQSFDVNNIISMIPGGFFCYVNDETERIILANEALLDIFECENMNEFISLTGNSFKGIVHEDDYERVEDEIKKQINNSTKNFDQVKYKIRTKTGKIKNVIDYGHLVEKEYNDDIFYVFIVEEV